MIMAECMYPNCEDCEYYKADKEGYRMCTVPVVITKQTLYFAEDRMEKLENRMAFLESVVRY